VTIEQIAAMADEMRSAVRTETERCEAFEEAVELLRMQAKRIAQLEDALIPFAKHFAGNLQNLEGGALVSRPFPMQFFKDAQKALKGCQ